jgi:hypothetical protein
MIENILKQEAQRRERHPCALFFQRLPHSPCDHARFIVDRERHGALESMRARDEDAESAIERVGGDPCFMRAPRMLAACDDGCLDALAAAAGYAFSSEDRERHKA